MRQTRAVFLVLLLCAGSTSCSADVDAQEVVRRYAEAWSAGGAALESAITGTESERLIDSLSGLAGGDLTATSLASVSDEDESTVKGIIALDFADGGRLEVSIRATVEDGRVHAEPGAVSVALTTWEPPTLEAFGHPARGDILSRDRTLLARGPLAQREVKRPGLGPAVELIDEPLELELGGQLGRRFVAGDEVLAESQPVDGNDVTTSLDDAMQAAAERSLGRSPGVLIAVDPGTGGIRALASNPDSRAPEQSPAVSAYSPGSAFKIVTAAAALENGLMEPDDEIDCPASLSLGDRLVTNFESRGYGPITFEKAFAVSCNTAFAQIGIGVGARALLGTAQRFGFRVGPELSEPGSITPPTSRSELGVWSFGAAGMLASPLQMVGIGSAIARGGTWVEPAWIDDDDPGERILSPATATTLVAMMEEVVSNGTGRAAALPGVRVAGKTGTADPAEEGAQSDAWFVGFVPVRSPRLVAVALLPGGGLGGEAAAPVVRSFFFTTKKSWE